MVEKHKEIVKMKGGVGRVVVFLTLAFMLINIVPYVNEGPKNVVSAVMNLQKGDIVFGDFTPLALAFGGKSLPGDSNDHVAIVGNYGFFWESCPYIAGTARWGGVQYTHMMFWKLICTNWKVARIPANSSQRNAMITFCQGQWKDDYQWSYVNDFRYETCFCDPCWADHPAVTNQTLILKYSEAIHNEYSNQWHCAELVWAAWMHGANIDLDPTPYKQWGFPSPYNDESDICSFIITVLELRKICEDMGTIYNYQTGLPET